MGAAAPGDVILVHPQAGNQAYQKVALAVNTPRLTIKAAGGAGERIPLNGAGGDYSGRGPVPRAIVQFNPGADGCVLEGFELLGAHNESHNGAGVRINQADDVTIRSCDIHHNDMGIMSNGDAAQGAAGNQLIENCLVHHNGDPQEPGQNHNLYLGEPAWCCAGVTCTPA
ncbi:MAG: right-handed parallel beta-helix repeat-containing protein [Kiritimatiellia bacterium]